MRSDGISTLNMSMLLRSSVTSTQRKIAAGQIEMSTGRHHDMGLALGSRVSGDIQYRFQLDQIEKLMTGGKMAANRAELTQSTLESITSLSSSFMQVLTGARNSDGGQALARDTAMSSLAALTDLVNVTYDGQFLFGGANTQETPLISYRGSTAETAVNGAFLAEFGFAQSDAGVSGIDGSAMKTFLDGAFHSLFEPPAWQANWSSATDKGVKTRIGHSLMVDASSTASSAGIRQIAEVFTMMMALGEGNLSQSAFERVVDTALSHLGEAQLRIGEEQSRIGVAQSQIAASIDQMSLGAFTLTKNIQLLEAVDPYVTVTTVNELMRQLELSYTITGRLSGLSLTKFI